MKKSLTIVAAMGLLASLIPGPAQANQWEETTVFEREVAHETPAQDLHVAYLRGEPNKSDATLYDITVGLSDQPDQTVSIPTRGLVTEDFGVKLLHLPKSMTAARLQVVARRDVGARGPCLGVGDSCTINQPFSDVQWFLNNGGAAVLQITLVAQRDGATVAERTVRIPFAGQLF